MRNLKSYFNIFSLVVVLMLAFSCVSDDSFFPEENGEITSTIALVTALNEFGTDAAEISEENLCFSFVYPIVLGYNNDSSIRISDFQGLVNVLTGQSGNFNVNGIQFPFQITFNGTNTTTTVQNEAAFLGILRECQIDTFRDVFNSLFRQCFKFDYPVTLINSNNIEVEIEDEQSLLRFIDEEGTSYQPNFKFPISVFVAPGFTTSVQLSTYFDFYQVANACVGCPEIRFDITSDSDFQYNITANFEIRDSFDVSLIVNGETDANTTLDGNVFRREFRPRTYEVCVKVISPDCPEGKKVCQSLTVEPVCPELSFQFEQEQGTLQYIFTADFVGINDIVYDWVVDDQIAEEADGGGNGDNQLLFQLTPGMHRVCIRTETPDCPNGTEFCEDIVVCPELAFIAEQQGDTTTYEFIADFPGIGDVQYDWKIDNQVQETDGGVDGDNTFTFQFEPGATYQVCISTVIEGCNPSPQFCQEIQIP